MSSSARSSGPVDQLSYRSGGWVVTKESDGFGMADVQKVGQWIVGADRVDKVPLQTLCD